MDGMPMVGRGVDVCDGAELAGPDDLVFVEQEHGDPGRGNQLVELWSSVRSAARV